MTSCEACGCGLCGGGAPEARTSSDILEALRAAWEEIVIYAEETGREVVSQETAELIMAALVAHTVHHPRAAASDMLEALREIADPITAMRKRAEAEGNRLSGMAYQIANDPNYLKQIARAAIALAEAPPQPIPTNLELR